MVRSKAARLDEREKIWQRMLSAHASFEVKSIKIIESPIFAPQRVDLCRALAFVGLHGTGKTLLLRMLEAAFGYTTPAAMPPFISGDQGKIVKDGEVFSYDPEGAQAIIEIELKTPDSVIVRRVDLSESRESRRKIWTDVLESSFLPLCASPLHAFTELGIVFQEYDTVRRLAASDKGREVKSAKLKAIGNILGRSYSKIAVRPPFSDVDPDPGIWAPYVTASLGTQIIDSSMMSQGELWVHYVLNWFFDQEVQKGSLALLDEPEAFLAARAQRPFIDEVARQALGRDSQLIIATHSPEVLARFPLDNIRMCIASDEGIRVIKPSSTLAIRESIGIETPVRMLILVEDELSRDIIHILFARYDRALTREAEVIPVDGAGEVKNGLRILQHIKKLGCVGILDADEKAKVESGHPALFLPGTRFPEDELISAANREAVWTASRLNTAADDLLAAIASCRGLAHQYWLESVARQLGVDEAIIIHQFTGAWLRGEDIEHQASALVRHIRSELPSYG